MQLCPSETPNRTGYGSEWHPVEKETCSPSEAISPIHAGNLLKRAKGEIPAKLAQIVLTCSTTARTPGPRNERPLKALNTPHLHSKNNGMAKRNAQQPARICIEAIFQFRRQTSR